MKNYAQRDIENQEFYIHHVAAMTEEDLHSKSDIAAELAHRDAKIKRLHEALTEVLHSESYQAISEICEEVLEYIESPDVSEGTENE